MRSFLLVLIALVLFIDGLNLLFFLIFKKAFEKAPTVIDMYSVYFFGIFRRLAFGVSTCDLYRRYFI